MLSHSRGVSLYIARPGGSGRLCGDGRPLFARLTENGDVTLNRKEMTMVAARDEIRSELSSRAERVVYFLNDPNVPVERFEQFTSTIGADSSPVDLVMVTPKVIAEGWSCETPEFSVQRP